jgi:hypothetical protein
VSKFFISHASNDKPLVQAVANLIETGLDVTHREIFCSSLDGQGIPPGADFKTFIGEKLKDTEVVIALISENFYLSSFCMCELGATWIQAKTFIPLLVPPITFANLKAVLAGMQSLRVDHIGDLDLFYETVKPMAGKNFSVLRWNLKKEEFASNLPATLEKIAKPNVVKMENHEKLVIERNDYKKELAKLLSENSGLKDQIDKLSKVKDSNEVSHILFQGMSEKAKFEALVSAASEQVKPLHWVVREALYQSTKGAQFAPSQDEIEAAVDFVEKGLLRGNGQTFYPREDHPKIKKARKAIDELRHYLSQCSPEFTEAYEQEYNDLLDISVRPFWGRHLSK